MKTAEAAKGRWREILPALGVPLAFLNGKHQACPRCGGKDRARFVDWQGTGSFWCNSCDNKGGSGFDLLQATHGWTFAHAAREVEAYLGVTPDFTPKPPNEARIRALEIWRASKECAFDPVRDYLNWRGIELGGLYSLRFCTLSHKTTARQRHPVMLAHFCTHDGVFGTLHRTYLADVTPKKMFWPGGVPAGGAVRLMKPAEEMGIAEGIETALSASVIFKIPVWAATNDALLARWIPPKVVQRVWIFGDNDENGAGQAAAYSLLTRVHALGLGHLDRLQIPPKVGTDWNDVLRERSA